MRKSIKRRDFKRDFRLYTKERPYVPLFVMESIKTLLWHPLVPIVFGAGVVWDAPGNITVRGLFLIGIWLWLCIDVGIHAKKLKWQTPKRIMFFCASSCLSGILTMHVMKWLLEEKLKEQQYNVRANLTVHPFMPSAHRVFRTGITVTNGGATDIQDHVISCFVRRFVTYPAGGIANLAMVTTLPQKADLKAYGDAETSYCLTGIAQFPGWPYCADVTVTVSYSLATQPNIKENKPFRYVASGMEDEFDWHQQQVDYPGDFCPEPKAP